MNKNRKIFIIMPIVLLLFCCALVPCFLLCKNSNGIISTNSAKNDNGKIDVKLCTYEDVSYEDNTLFVKSQLLIAADAEYSYSDIEKIISKYNGKIVGYIEFTNDYQIEFDKMDYDTLNKTAELLKTSLDKSNITLNLAYYQDNDTDKVPINKFEKKDKNGNWWRDAIKLTDLEKDNNSYQEVKIGIFDTLFDTENQDISYAIDSNNIWFNDKEKINKIASGMHGTDVTGFLAAKKNNKFGIDGVANNVKIYGYAYKGNIPDYNPVSIMDIKYWNAKMLAKGVKVINISSGNTKLLVAAQNGVARAKKALKEVSESLSTFYGKYIDAGYEFVVVKSAGNENGMQFIYCTESKDNPYGIKVYDSKTDGSLNNCKKIEGVLYDAQYDIWGAISDSKVKNRVIIVGSSSEENTRAYHSVTGKRVDIYAPGERLRSLSDDAPSYGTSFAAPMVSGTVSLMWGTNPNIEAEKIKYLLVTSATQPIKDENYQINSDNSDVIKMYKCLLDSKNSVDRAKTYKSKSATAKKANGIICGIVRIYEDGTILYNKEDCLVSIYKDNHEETLYKELTADKYGEFDTEIETGNYIIKAKTNDGSYESDAYKLKIDSGDSQYIDDLYMYRSKNQIIDNLVNGILEKENFIGHPIEIVRREIMIREKCNDKIFIFVAGTSESGKSGGINYLKDNYSEIQHIKIRDVFPKVYEDTFSKLSFEEWQNFEENRDLNNFWKLFVNKVYEMADDDKSIIILDTMYGVQGMIELFNILGDKVNLLYIDAPFNDRVIREYNRLRSDSINGTRKADLTITIEDIIERTIKKDRKKNKKGADKLPLLRYNVDGSSIEIAGIGEQFTTIINNDDTIDNFHIMLDNYINSKLVKSKEYVK